MYALKILHSGSGTHLLVRQAKLGASYRVPRKRAGSPNWAKPNQQPIPSVALVAETGRYKSNKTGEAYTGNTIGRRGGVPPQNNTAP